MRFIKFSSKFKKDFRREERGKHKKILRKKLREVLHFLEADQLLPARFKDHPLSGPWQDFNDCHILPDLVLIYRKPDKENLELIRMGSHSELGL